ncbi:hypothetical protein BDC45DRAFT_498986 [Circinella umbellata]|nr:hypothetical protein BDC45DRAFT_498986 [Circinella umbellata]
MTSYLHIILIYIYQFSFLIIYLYGKCLWFLFNNLNSVDEKHVLCEKKLFVLR